MMFPRNKYFDELIMKIKNNKDLIETLDYEELAMLMEYCVDLVKWEEVGDIYD